ncbi:class I adenylate-forming enzyme family protein [Vitiosangium sp. GDMCC 1.1324]|uniref:class I adenylate-forming enzyme family protein n=1 Tax=Vitiosangium sp. (strain GDMCC 1.1324) TaxID=2138576 RepID=UPI000D388A59|nr:class I adenylate-forming enzyme family protein [Vitiosangium sp. GDMCC 1.1324]PTL80868.1 long-chain fatty acid--CoA ligase [Vitiosangium sp. GDMCC 1.1324]
MSFPFQLSGPASRLTPALIDSFLNERITDATGGPAPEQTWRISAIADGWRQLGLRPGDLVLVAMPNGPSLLAHFFGVLAAGGVPALVAPATPSARLKMLMETFSARGLIIPRLPEFEMAGLERSSLLGSEVALLPPSQPPPLNPGEVVMLTSGTSGFASGCVFDLEALLRNAAKHTDAVGQRGGDSVLVNLPLYYSYALVAQAFATLLSGGQLVISGPPFNPESYLRLIHEHHITVSSVTPLLVRTLLAQERLPEGLRVLTVGGDALAAPQVAQLLKLRPGGELYLTYGLSEAGPRVATLAAHLEPPHRYSSVGRPLPGTHVQLEGQSIPGQGELLVSSDTLMKRRIGIVEGRKAQEWRGPGLLGTGDIFQIDAEGYLSFVGRLSDFVIKGGEKISLASVRRLATSLPGVVSARTEIFVDRVETSYDLHLVVTQPGLTSEHVRSHLQGQLRRTESPRTIHLINANDSRAQVGHK